MLLKVWLTNVFFAMAVISFGQQPSESKLDLLQQAIAVGDAKKVRELAMDRSILNLGGVSGIPPIHSALNIRRIECLDILLSAGADVNVTDWQGNTAAHILSGTFSFAKITEGRDPIFITSFGPFQSREERFALMVKLLAKGLRVNVRNGEQSTPLHLACDQMDIAMAGLLLSSGAFTNARDRDGKTPLIKICSAENLGIGPEALDNHSGPNQSSSFLQNYQFQRAQEPIVRMLLDRGAEPLLRDKSGMSALDYCKKLKREGLADLLRTRIEERKETLVSDRDPAKYIITITFTDEYDPKKNRESVFPLEGIEPWSAFDDRLGFEISGWSKRNEDGTFTLHSRTKSKNYEGNFVFRFLSKERLWIAGTYFQITKDGMSPEPRKWGDLVNWRKYGNDLELSSQVPQICIRIEDQTKTPTKPPVLDTWQQH